MSEHSARASQGKCNVLYKGAKQPEALKMITIHRTEMCQSVFCQGDVNDQAANTSDSNSVVDDVA
jgi:hypothetical protein